MPSGVRNVTTIQYKLNLDQCALEAFIYCMKEIEMLYNIFFSINICINIDLQIKSS